MQIAEVEKICKNLRSRSIFAVVCSPWPPQSSFMIFPDQHTAPLRHGRSHPAKRPAEKSLEQIEAVGDHHPTASGFPYDLTFRRTVPHNLQNWYRTIIHHPFFAACSLYGGRAYSVGEYCKPPTTGRAYQSFCVTPCNLTHIAYNNNVITEHWNCYKSVKGCFDGTMDFESSAELEEFALPETADLKRRAAGGENLGSERVRQTVLWKYGLL